MKLFAPTENDTSQLFACVMDSFRHFGLEFSALIKSKLQPIFGESWIADLSRERNVRITLEDTSFLLKEILRNPNTPMRLCIPTHREIFKLIEQVLNERNKWFHNEVDIEIKKAIEAVVLIQNLAQLIPLELQSDLSELLEILKQIKNGKLMILESGDDLREKIDSSQVSLQALQKESDEIQNKLSRTEDRVQKLQDELNQSNQSIDHRDIIIQKITLEREFLKNQISDLKESLNVIELEKNVLKNLMSNFEKIQLSKYIDSNFRDTEIEIGDDWPFRKGEHRLTLSSRFKDIYLSDSSIFLSDLIGKSSKEMASNWLKLKPNGGPIWIDGYGHLTTYLGEKLCYLGKVSLKDVKKILNAFVK